MDLREQILAARDLDLDSLEIPEWGCTVYVGVMGADARDYWTGLAQERAAQPVREQSLHARAIFATLVLYDADGNRLFTEADVAALGRKNFDVLDRVFAAAAKNKLRPEDLEELEKNSASDPTAA